MKKVIVLFATIESFPRNYMYHMINILILDTETFLYHIKPAQVVCQLEVLVRTYSVHICLKALYTIKFEGEF